VSISKRNQAILHGFVKIEASSLFYRIAIHPPLQVRGVKAIPVVVEADAVEPFAALEEKSVGEGGEADPLAAAIPCVGASEGIVAVLGLDRGRDHGGEGLDGTDGITVVVAAIGVAHRAAGDATEHLIRSRMMEE
jgi:hypothetical protein